MPAFLGDVFHWIWQERTKIIALTLVLLLLAPQPAKGQFIDWAAIVAAINAIGTAISNVIGSGLQAINTALGAVNTILNTINSFFQNQIYPQAAINRARGVVGAVQGIYNAIRGLVNLNVASWQIRANSKPYFCRGIPGTSGRSQAGSRRCTRRSPHRRTLQRRYGI